MALALALKVALTIFGITLTRKKDNKKLSYRREAVRCLVLSIFVSR